MLGVNIEPYFSIERRVLIYFKFWESIVHLISASNFGCQYRTLFLNQTSCVNIDAAAAASLCFGWHIEILSQHYIIIVDNGLPEYLWTFQSQGSAGIAQAKRIRRTRHSAGSGGVGKSSSKIIAKIFLSRNLAFLLAARRPPHSTPDWCHRLLFCLLFFNRFLEGIFSIFAYFWHSLGTPKSSKINKNRPQKVSFFRAHDFHALLAIFC